MIGPSDPAPIMGLKAYLGPCFHMKDLGVLKSFLGVEVARHPDGIYLTQRKYDLDIITDAGLLGAKPAAFPMEPNHKLPLATGAPMNDPVSYRRLIGRLVYLTITRPDLSYSLHCLAQFMQTPRAEDWEAALRVVRYIKGSPGQGIFLSASSNLHLMAYCDSDWAGCPISRRSLSAYLVFLGHSPISWKKEHRVSRSSAEAEYRSMASATSELTWLSSILLALGIDHPRPMSLFCDSMAALDISSNLVFHERTKHIEVDCHYVVRDKLKAGVIATSHISSSEQPADLLTKALGAKQFAYLLRKLGIRDLHA